MMDYKLDDYEAIFTDYNELREETNKFMEDSQWIPGAISKKLLIEAFEPIEAQEVAKNLGVNYDLVFDTGEHTQLLITNAGKRYLLRDTAVDSILETAKINGSALGKISKDNLATILNMCLNVAKGDSLLLLRGGKICACLSDSIYKIMPIPELLDVTIKVLSDKFGETVFIEGSNNYRMTDCFWKFPEAQGDILEAYDDIVATHSKSMFGHSGFIPAVHFMTSDIGKCAATLIPGFLLKNTFFRINDGIKVAHKRASSGDDGIELYTKEIDKIFAKFADIEKTLAEMAKTEIENPINAFVGLCKKAGIPKKYVAEAYEDLERFACGGSVYMDDIYLCISSCVGTAKRLGAPKSKQFELEENAAKILHMQWRDFDVPGIVTWS
ncbi:MAG: hypothetical protein IJT36_03790 [Alphaproteobacteria bacterium]|nr:hypothetical protein [Alphaproteobacteria bacterium]